MQLVNKQRLFWKLDQSTRTANELQFFDKKLKILNPSWNHQNLQAFSYLLDVYLDVYLDIRVTGTSNDHIVISYESEPMSHNQKTIWSL